MRTLDLPFASDCCFVYWHTQVNAGRLHLIELTLGLSEIEPASSCQSWRLKQALRAWWIRAATHQHRGKPTVPPTLFRPYFPEYWQLTCRLKLQALIIKWQIRKVQGTRVPRKINASVAQGVHGLSMLCACSIPEVSAKSFAGSAITMPLKPSSTGVPQALAATASGSIQETVVGATGRDSLAELAMLFLICSLLGPRWHSPW